MVAFVKHAKQVARQRRPFSLVAMVTALLVAALVGTRVSIMECFVGARNRFVHESRKASLATTRHAIDSPTIDSPTLASEWRLGVGHAIDVLRRDVPALFSDELCTPDFSIYSENIQVADARLPSFQLNGLAAYQRILSTLQWSVRAACVHRRMEIMSMTPPVNNEIYMRWRLTLQLKDMLAPARGFLSFGTSLEVPFVVEGYSRYEFEPWSASIIKHTIDITNPPTYIEDLVARYAQGISWPSPVQVRFGVPFYHAVVPQPDRPWGALAGLTPSNARRVGPVRSARNVLPFLPKGFGCEDDFECNDGKANFPLQCCELPIIGKFCCEPDNAVPVSRTPAYVPLPVPVDGLLPGGGERARKPWQAQ